MENKNVEVSIVLPIYNVEKYLQRCLESLINQTFSNIEIIALNNGSTDKSLEILNHYAYQDKRILVINNENIGVSKARNIGIKKAKGKYIVFVDSDDWIDANMIETLHEAIIDNNCDLAICTYVREFANHSKEKVFNLPEINIYEGIQVKNELLRKLVGPIQKELANPEYLDALGTVWAKMYKASTLKDNNLKFVDLNEIGSGEDTLFNIYVFNEVNKAILLNKPMYHYWRENRNSITSKYITNFIEKRKNYFKYINDFILNNDLGDEYKIALNNRICTSVLGMGLLECSKSNKISFIKKIRNIRSILNEDYIDEAYKRLELKYFTLHWRVFYFFNKYKLSIPSYLMINGIEVLRKAL